MAVVSFIRPCTGLGQGVRGSGGQGVRGSGGQGGADGRVTRPPPTRAQKRLQGSRPGVLGRRAGARTRRLPSHAYLGAGREDVNVEELRLVARRRRAAARAGGRARRGRRLGVRNTPRHGGGSPEVGPARCSAERGPAAARGPPRTGVVAHFRTRGRPRRSRRARGVISVCSSVYCIV